MSVHLPSGLILVPHGDLAPEPGQPRAWWPLSAAGRAHAIALAAAPWWAPVEQIWCGSWMGAFETAHLIAGRSRANVTAVEALAGVGRRPAIVDTAETEALAYLAGAEHEGWEPRAAVLARLERWLDSVLPDDRPEAVIADRLTLALLLSLHRNGDAVAAWHELV